MVLDGLQEGVEERLVGGGIVDPAVEELGGASDGEGDAGFAEDGAVELEEGLELGGGIGLESEALEGGVDAEGGIGVEAGEFTKPEPGFGTWIGGMGLEEVPLLAFLRGEVAGPACQGWCVEEAFGVDGFVGAGVPDEDWGEVLGNRGVVQGQSGGALDGLGGDGGVEPEAEALGLGVGGGEAEFGEQ